MKDLQDLLSYKFNNLELLERALTHSSYINESYSKNKESYERLEFLGDAVLELTISRVLYDKFPKEPEGSLSKMRAKIVCEASLYKIAKRFNLGNYIKLSKGERATGGEDRQSILADVVESVIAAVYLDSSFEVANKFVLDHFKDEIEGISIEEAVDDYKSLLQILLQSKGLDLPEYDLVEEKGPDHMKEFTSSVIVQGRTIAKGKGRSKRISQQEAAKRAYEILNNVNITWS